MVLSNVKCRMSKVNKVKLLSEHTSGLSYHQHCHHGHPHHDHRKVEDEDVGGAPHGLVKDDNNDFDASDFDYF